MRVRGRRGSRNIEDRRRQGGGPGGKAAPIGGVGLILVLAIGYSAEEERLTEFSSQILATTEQVWAQIFPRQVGKNYTPPTSFLNSDVTQIPCGGASVATGPFYCSADEKAYLKTDFFATLSHQLGAKGDFAAPYVIAHEVPHLVQNELRILGQVYLAHQQSNQTDANALTVRLELQADCHSGVWARSVEGLLEPNDIEEALNAARMFGDDQLQKRAGRVPQPLTFTHGTSKQRASWFAKGFSRLAISTSATRSARVGCNL